MGRLSGRAAYGQAFHDLSHQGLSDSAIRALRDDYGFRCPRSELQQQLEAARFWYQTARHWQTQPPKKDQRKHLQAVQKHSQALRDALYNLTDHDYLVLSKYRTDFSREAVGEELLILAESADNAVNAVTRAKSRRGNTRDEAARKLIGKLVALYESETGKAPGYTQNSSEYSGPFIEFASRVFDLYKIEISNSFLGDTLKELRQTTR